MFTICWISAEHNTDAGALGLVTLAVSDGRGSAGGDHLTERRERRRFSSKKRKSMIK